MRWNVLKLYFEKMKIYWIYLRTKFHYIFEILSLETDILDLFLLWPMLHFISVFFFFFLLRYNTDFKEFVWKIF